jgi:hypothetical protein
LSAAFRKSPTTFSLAEPKRLDEDDDASRRNNEPLLESTTIPLAGVA